MKKFYINDLKDYFYMTGSYGRYYYRKQIHLMLKNVSETLPELENNAISTGKDIDLLYISDNNEKIIEKIRQNKNLEIIQMKKDLIMLKNNKTNIHYDIFICKKQYFYSYYLFTLVGKQINIILRKKAIKKNLLLNQYGIFKRDTIEEINIPYNEKKNEFYNMLLILKYLYSS
jgi:DNA polymerase/3'-5' exonuclease PolX